MKIKAILIAIFILSAGLLFSNEALACATGDCRTDCLDTEKTTGEKCTSSNGDNSQEGDCCVKKSGIDLTSGKVCSEDNRQVAGRCSVGVSCYGVGPGLAITEGQCPSGQICCKTQAYHDATQGKPETTSTVPSPATTTPTSSKGDSTSSGLVPCTNNCTLCHLVIGFKRIFNFFIGLLFVATMLAITICGVFYMVSSGSKGMIEMAKKGLTYSLMAFAIGMGGWLLINTVMIGLGFQHPYGGNWWEFTCDTTPGRGPVSSGTAPNWSAGKTGTGTPNGNCGGIKTVGESAGKCDTASPELSSLLQCINEKMGAGSGIYISNRGLNRGAGCHGGGNCQGIANAADLFGNPTAAANAAKECGTADTILINEKAYYGPGNSQVGNQSDHTDHAHVSVNNKQCGCDWGK